MKVILLEEVRGKGGEGDVVDVARGFANNYLLRFHKALKATPGNLKQLEERRANIAKREEVRVANAEELKAILEGTQIVVKAKVGEEGQLFGSVTAQMVADGVKDVKDVDIDRRRVEIRTPIKQTGAYEIEISLYREIKALVTIVVVDENLPTDVAVAAALGELPEGAVAQAEADGETEAQAEATVEEEMAAPEEAAETDGGEDSESEETMETVEEILEG